MGLPELSGPSDKSEFDLPRKTKAQVVRADRVLEGLYRYYGNAECALVHTSPHELLIATILSAQCTDVAVNKATPALFREFPTPADYARVSPTEIEPFVRSLGFFRAKSKSIQGAMRIVTDRHGGCIPTTMEELLELPGVARKTANVVLGTAFGINVGVVVDTHVMRLSRRFGLSRHTDPKKIERDLMALFPRRHWSMLSHMLIAHGRAVCKAQRALCATHPLCIEFCSNAKTMLKKTHSMRTTPKPPNSATKATPRASRSGKR